MAQLDTPMPNAPLTPSEDASPASPQPQPVVDFSPATVPYNESFENDLMNLILHPPSNHSAPIQGDNNPMIPASQLPIPLSSTLRTHTSPIPGLHLTHANGYHTGGPGPSSATIQAFAEKLVREHGVDIQNIAEVRRVVRATMDEKMGDLRSRMAERAKAVKRNREIDDELEKLRLQRDDEVRVLEKMKGRR
ncbi:hypothetical protein BDU57DRAFT_129408 [Ampelomyces quisqualis]|uniref:Uncharacterized protein n=1 Tax=Ampelomyces quisqualis TaxID=50730 RepID=A0A6A5QUF9_AMPQU|nr:hypothetical protein BDU57DRAFT_129408 [Ampelomyces quisqualis]